MAHLLDPGPGVQVRRLHGEGLHETLEEYRQEVAVDQILISERCAQSGTRVHAFHRIDDVARTNDVSCTCRWRVVAAAEGGARAIPAGMELVCVDRSC